MKILGISGSIREKSLNTWLLNAAVDFISDENQFEIMKLNKIPLYNEDIDNNQKPDSVKEFLEIINESDMILFSSPEYNYGISGVLKNAIDWASRPAFNSPLLSKPCGIFTASASPIGGARAHIDLKKTLLSTLSIVYPSLDFLLPSGYEKFDEDGKLIDNTSKKYLKKYIEGFIVWGNSLK